MTARYRRLPTEVTALQWTGANLDEVARFLGDDLVDQDGAAGVLWVRTLNGVVTVPRGEWLVQGVRGEHHPVSDDSFAETYQPVGVAGG